MTYIDIEHMVAPAAAEPLEPIPTPVDQVANFPHSDEVPEGCVVIKENFADTFFFSTYISEETYVTRETEDGELDLKMTIYTPDAVTQQIGGKERAGLAVNGRAVVIEDGDLGCGRARLQEMPRLLGNKYV